MKELNTKAPLRQVIALLLCLAVLSCQGVSGLYARYTATGSGTATVQVASINCVVRSEQTQYSGITINVDVPAVYAVVEKLIVENTGDVAYDYDLTLQDMEGDAHGLLTAPVRGNGAVLKHIYTNGDGVSQISGMDFGSICGGKTYTPGKVYYAYSADDVNYTWYDSDSAVLSGTLGLNGTHYYKIMYFIDLSSPIANFNPTAAGLAYSITCTQVD